MGTRSAVVDALVSRVIAELEPDAGRLAGVALGAYGRRELTPHAEVELLIIRGDRPLPEPSAPVWLPLTRAEPRIEPRVRTLNESETESRRSFPLATSLLDARLVAGDPSLFAELVQRTAQPLRKDRERLRRRLSATIQRRHASYAPATAAVAPDLVEGRGGLRDLEALRWLTPELDPRTQAALDFVLATVSAIEEQSGQAVQRLTPQLAERITQGSPDRLLADVYGHSRWVAFRLDGALASPRADRPLGASLHLRNGYLTGERLPGLERTPSLGLRVANLVGFAPPDQALLDWAAAPGGPVVWDQDTLEQLWLLLRAADWRAWEFLDVTGLLGRYLPELVSASTQGGLDGSDLVLDAHSFLALRRLHEWTESDDALARRVWRPIRHRDWLYLSVLLHELDVAAVARLVDRLRLPPDARAAIVGQVQHARLLAETAIGRDLHDEDLLLDLAGRVGTRRRLRALVLLTAAHDRALGGSAWTPWKADLLRQLFGVLEAMLGTRGDVAAQRVRALEQRRQRVGHELERRNQAALLPMVDRLPRRYLLARSPAFIARHLILAGEPPLGEREVRIEARRHRQPGVWDILVVAHDRPGLLATVSGVLALRGASVLGADATTGTDGLVLDVFTVGSAYGAPLEAALWPRVANDLQAALAGRLPLNELLATPSEPIPGVRVSVDNTASQFYSLVEVRAPDQVGLLYRVARTLHGLGLDVHHAKIATFASGVFDVFYVWDDSGAKVAEARAAEVAETLTRALTAGVAAARPDARGSDADRTGSARRPRRPGRGGRT